MDWTKDYSLKHTFGVMYRSGEYLVRRNTSTTGWHAELGNQGYLTDTKLGKSYSNRDFSYLKDAKKVCEKHCKRLKEKRARTFKKVIARCDHLRTKNQD